MKFKFISAIALCAMAVMSCDEDTSMIGGSLTHDNDKLTVTTQNFNVSTASVVVDSVYSTERQSYLGKVKDPETNTYVESQFTTQFFLMENIGNDLPKRDSILSLDNGLIAADSCLIQISFDLKTSYGDSLTAVKMKMSELNVPIAGDGIHYTSFDPEAAGYIRKGGYEVNKMFSLRDLTLPDSVRNLIKTNLTSTTENYNYDVLKIRMNEPYTDKDGNTYNNYGSYLLRNYYDHPEYFKNTYTFLHKISPGFQFKLTDGIGLMGHVREIDMFTYYHYQAGDETRYSYLRTTATEEVVQTNKVVNDHASLEKLAADQSCTYLKTPSGIFTEVTLPVDEICSTHTSDSLLSAKVIFKRLNNQTDAKSLTLSVPSQLLMLSKDSLDQFFKGKDLADNIYEYKTSLTANAYTFSNISNLITRMYMAKAEGLKSDPDWVTKHPNWNKVLLVPIEEVTVTYSSTSSTAVSLKHKLGLSSTKLVRGTTDNPIKIEVIYAKFQD